MKTVIIKRINLRSVYKVVLISSVLSIGMIVVFSIICGLIFSLFTRSSGGASGSDIFTQLLILLIPYIISLFILILFSLFFLISYNYFAPRLGGFEFEVEKNSEFIVEKDKKQ